MINITDNATKLPELIKCPMSNTVCPVKKGVGSETFKINTPTTTLKYCHTK
jgi:hypothetical protein